MATDPQTWTSDDILTQVERAAMAKSPETLIPFLDYKVIEFVWVAPLSMKVRRGWREWLRRQSFCRHSPKEIIERPKIEFGIPLRELLSDPL